MHHVHPIVQPLYARKIIFPLTLERIVYLEDLCEEECRPLVSRILHDIRYSLKTRTMPQIRVDEADRAADTAAMFFMVQTYADGIDQGQPWNNFKHWMQCLDEITHAYDASLTEAMHLLSQEPLHMISQFRDDLEEIYYMLESMNKDD